MTNRELMRAILAGERLEFTPQWLMAFANMLLVERVIPKEMHYDGYYLYPGKGQYPFAALGEEGLIQRRRFNDYIDGCAFPIGWGAHAAFGHGGPGEFNCKVLESRGDGFIVEYETGVKKEVNYRPHNTRAFGYPITDESDLDKIRLPDPKDPERYRGFAQDVAWAKENGQWTIGWVNGFYSGIHYFLRPFEDLCLDMALNPGRVKKLADLVGGWNLAAAQMMCERGVDCIGLCDDLGSGTSLLFNPAIYRGVFWPWHKKLCDLVHAYGAVVHLHSHGAILPLLPDLAAAGIDVLNPLDPDDKMPMDKVRAAVGPKVVLCGGMHKLFFEWTGDEQATHLKEVIANGRRYWPHILMDSAGILDSVDKPGFDRFLQLSREIRHQTVQ
jgi:hypothetical protein